MYLQTAVKVCTIRMFNNIFRLVLVNVCMPYEEDGDMTADFADQLIERLVNSNSDCHVIAGGDYNVDFSRDRIHTAMLASLCDDKGLNPVVHHDKCSIHYTYNFDKCKFSILDHFLLSGNTFNKSIGCAYVIHDVYSISDHEPITLQLLLEAKHTGFCDRIHTSHVSWVKAVVLSRCIKIPTDALLCTDSQCHNFAHFQSVNKYAREITDACIDAGQATIPHS
jgi:hypothetical protein